MPLIFSNCPGDIPPPPLPLDTMINFADDEIPSGSIDGVNVTYTLVNSPAPPQSLQLFYNGGLLAYGSDFTLTGNTIHCNFTPILGSSLLSYYRWNS